MKIRNFADIKSLLFGNKTTKQTILKNTFWLSLADGISKLLKLVLIVYIARILGAEDYGKLSFALSFLGIFVILPNLIHGKIVVREFSKDKDKEKEFNSIFTLRFILSLINLGLIFVILSFTDFDSEITKIMLILAGYAVSEHFFGFLGFLFDSRQKMEYLALVKVVQSFLLTAFVFFVIFNFSSLVNISYGYLFSSLAALAFFLIFLRFKFYPVGLSFDVPVWKKYIMMSWPFFASSVFAAIYNQVDSVIMGSLGQITQTGFYNAAYRMAGGVFIPIGLIAGSFYPALNKAFAESREKFQIVWDYFFESMIILAAPVIAGGIILAPKIINFLYGPGYSKSILAFQILLVMVGITFLQHPLYQALLIFNKQTKLLWVSIAGAIVSVILNFLLIPRYSLYGAAAVSVVTSLVILAIFAIAVKKEALIKIFNAKFLHTFGLAVFSSLIMSFFISSKYLRDFHFIFLAITGGAVYFGSFFFFKFFIKKNDLKIINK
jgi:O-antigen/teichoic acid export membrane protein